jgi:hypothetical protein
LKITVYERCHSRRRYGKRMQSALPKVLHPLAGKPLLRM